MPDYQPNTITKSLDNRIVEFLTSLPNITNIQAQQALILGAGLDQELLNQINFGSPPGQFFQLLIPILRNYGELEDGRDALVAVLESARELVGSNRKKQCDTLIEELEFSEPPPPSPSKARIYISSTYQDLNDYKTRVSAVVKQRGHEDVVEPLGADHERSLDRCLEAVASCDLYIGIFAWQYGIIPPGASKSITELEFRKAIETKRDYLIFLLAEDAPWSMKLVDKNLESIDALRTELSQQYNSLVRYFRDKEELRTLALEEITRWEKANNRVPTSNLTDWEAYRGAIIEKHQWVRLAVIAGAPQDRITKISLTDIFVPQMLKSGYSHIEVPEEVLEARDKIFNEFSNKFPERPEDELFLETESEEAVEDLEEWDEEESLPGMEMEETSQDFEEPPGEFSEYAPDVLGRERAQVFLGSPGSGKSTLLLYAMLSACASDRSMKTHFPSLPNEIVPFLIELRKYVLDKDKNKVSNFIEYIIANVKEIYGQVIEAQDLNTLLREKGRRTLVLFDGLDEIFKPSERDRVIEQFQVFARSYPHTQIIVTSRIVGYVPEQLKVADFKHYTLLDFNRQQVRQFVPKWYKCYTWEGDERTATGLIQRIEENPRLMELSGNPLILTMMAVIHKHQALPEKRWKLYERCTEVLLEHWDIKRHVSDAPIIPLQHKAEILQRVSNYMLQHGQPGREVNINAIAENPLKMILADYLGQKYQRAPGDADKFALEILKDLRERAYILAEIGERIFGFVHRTFMEYFAACHCQAEFNARRSDYTWLKQEIFGHYWQQDEWREVLLLLIALIAAQKSPIQEIIDYLWKQCKPETNLPSNIIFAVQCLAEAGVIENEISVQEMVLELAKSIEENAVPSPNSDVNVFIETALSAFAMIAPMISIPSKVQAVITRLDQARYLRPRIIGWQMGFASQSKQTRQKFALDALENRQEAVRRGAITVLEREWPENDEVGRKLINVVRNDRHSRVRQAALETLQRAWTEKLEDVLDAIEAKVDEPQINRKWPLGYIIWIVKYLAKYWQGHAKAFELIIKLSDVRPRRPSRPRNPSVATEEYLSLRVRRQAVDSIIKSWPLYSDTFALLCNWVANDAAPQIRKPALQAIIDHWSADPEAFQIFSDRAIHDEDADIRTTAFQTIIQNWNKKPEILPFLHDRMVHDDVTTRRITALQTIIEYWYTDPDTLPFLRDLGTHDTVADIRKVIIQGINTHWPVDSETLLFLRERAVHDTVADIRKMAIHGICTHCPSDSETFLFLCERAVHDEEVGIRKISFEAIIQGWRNKPEILPFLCKRAVHDEVTDIRGNAIQVLRSDWLAAPDTFLTLWDRTLNDEDTDLRRISLRTIVQHWCKAPEILPLLHYQAGNDPVADIRTTAIQTILKYWYDDSGTLPLLYNEAVYDESPDIRDAALQTISRYWHDALDNIPIFYDRAVNDKNFEVRMTAILYLTGIPEDFFFQYKGKHSWVNNRAWDIEEKEEFKKFEKEEDVIEEIGPFEELAEQEEELAAQIFQELSDSQYTSEEGKDIKSAERELEDLMGLLDSEETEEIEEIKEVESIPGIEKIHEEIEEVQGFNKLDTLPLLHDRAVRDEAPYIRATAIQAISKFWRDDHGTLPLLCDRAVNDKDLEIRKITVQIISRDWHEAPETLPLLCDRAVHDKVPMMRVMALLAVANMPLGIIQVSHFIKEEYEFEEISEEIEELQEIEEVQGIAELNPRIFVRHRAKRDNNSHVRALLTQAIWKYWHDDTDTLMFLEDRAVNDPTPEIRKIAIQGMNEHWHNNPETLSTLRDRVLCDEDPDIRYTSFQMIIRYWYNHPDIFPFFIERTVNDENLDIRRTSLQALILYWRDNPETTQLLRDRAENDVTPEIRTIALLTIAVIPSSFYDNNDFLRNLNRKWLIHEEHDQLSSIFHDFGLRERKESAVVEDGDVFQNFDFDAFERELLKDHPPQIEPEKNTQTEAIEEMLGGEEELVAQIFQELSDSQYTSSAEGQIEGPEGELEDLMGLLDSDETTGLNKERETKADTEPATAMAAEEADLECMIDQELEEVEEIEIFPEEFEEIEEFSEEEFPAFEEVEEFEELEKREEGEKIQSIEHFDIDPDTLSLLYNRAIKDSDPHVRITIIQVISQYFHEAPGFLPLLHDRAANDGASEVRKTVIQIIAQYWRDDFDTFALIHDRAVNDNDPLVRGTAIQAISRYCRETPDTFSFLCERAQNDKDIELRKMIIWLLVTSWPDNPDTLAYLQSLKKNDDTSEIQSIVNQAIRRLLRDPQELRQKALSYVLSHQYDLAEQLLLRLLEQDFEIPGTHCHLARVYLLTDRYEEASVQGEQAWMQRAKAKPYVIPRILWIQLALIFLDKYAIDSQQAAILLGRLKSALNVKGAHVEWTMNPVLDHLRPRLDENAYVLLTALVSAMISKNKMSVLDGFPVWQQAKFIGLD